MLCIAQYCVDVVVKSEVVKHIDGHVEKEDAVVGMSTRWCCVFMQIVRMSVLRLKQTEGHC